MNRIFHLSFLLDRDGYNRIDLVSFYELSKLDEFIMERFKDTKDVRSKYNDDIGEFCLNNMEFIKKENKKNKRNWLGSIAIICDERDEKDQTIDLNKIPIIYQNNKKMLSKENCLAKIKEKLKDKNIVRIIFEEKRYLLSDYERDLLLKHYSRSDDKYLKSFGGNFFNRLKRCNNDEILYFYCRALMNVCKLNELTVKTSFGTIDNIHESIPINTKINKTNVFSKDAYLNDLISNANYEELFRIYDLDEINKETDLFEKDRVR